MHYKRSLGENAFDAANLASMLALMALTLYPMLHAFSASVSAPSELVKHQGLLFLPLGFSLKAYEHVFENPMILEGYRNTFFYLSAGTALNLTLTIFGAYVLARKGLYWKSAIMFFVVFTMFFSGGLIPLYLLVKDAGLVNSPLAVILPAGINTWNLIVMRTSFMALPDSLMESARIDGANDFTVLFRIVIPLSMPVIAVMILFYGVERWNAWFYAMIFLRERQLYPLQLILREILVYANLESMITTVTGLDREPVAETVKYATIVVATLPILFVYPFLQKYFVKGVLIGALKG